MASTTPSADSASADEVTAKAVHKRYQGLLTVRTKAIKGKGAWYWPHLEPMLLHNTETGLPKAVKLRCSLCDAVFSASNPSRTASEHLKRGTCPNFNSAAKPISSVSPSSAVAAMALSPPSSPTNHNHRKRISSSYDAPSQQQQPHLVLSGGSRAAAATTTFGVIRWKGRFGSFGYVGGQRGAEVPEVGWCEPGEIAASEVLMGIKNGFLTKKPHYDSLKGAWAWAQNTLIEHATDKREHIYTREQLEKTLTADPLWNASQLEMVHYGKMHGFTRMYWAKKILEWTRGPEEALEISLYLNDKGWKERPIYGKIRYMNYAGCKRKFDVDKYIAYVDKLVRELKKRKAENMLSQ
ncbi:Deoxyribodipyrimidine photo-lyase [Glycine soja]|nr:Deoxyribodipyrimidine photo-lyase [Glycine soja]